MKLSHETIAILKHAASINPGIIIDPGSMIFSMHESKTTRMQATVQEDFPVQVALINLNQFLNSLTLFTDPELEFCEESVFITGNNGQKIQYYYSDPSVIQQSNKQLKAEIDYEFEFNLSKEDISQLNKAAAVIGVDDICVYNDGADIYISALDKRRQAGNHFDFMVGSDSSLEGKHFKIFFRKTNLKLTNNNYHVKVSSKGLSTWIAEDAQIPSLLFYIATERDSEFE